MIVTNAFRWHRRDLLLVLIAVATPLFFMGGPDWLAPPVIRTLWNQGHWMFFACLMVWWQGRWPLPHPRQWLLATLAVLVLSAVIESVQTLVGREAGWGDVLCNVAGTWLGLFWGQAATRLIWLGRWLAVGVVLWQLQVVFHVGLAQWHQQRQFPVLGNFESRLDQPFWEGRVERVSAPVAEGRYSLAVEVGGATTTRYSGVHLKQLEGDWRGYKTLKLSLYNPDDTALALTLRINDTQHDRGDGAYSDRYNGRVTLEPGWNHVEIALSVIEQAPETRRMNLASVERLLLFGTDVKQSRWIYLDDLRLE
jgi:VanZ family protein